MTRENVFWTLTYAILFTFVISAVPMYLSIGLAGMLFVWLNVFAVLVTAVLSVVCVEFFLGLSR